MDPNPRRRHRRFSPEVVDRLMMLDEGTGEDIILSVAEQWGPCDITVLAQRSNLPVSEVVERVEILAEQGDVIVLGNWGSIPMPWSTRHWAGASLINKISQTLHTYHEQYPLRRGAPTQEVRSRLGVPQPVYLRVLARLTADEYVRRGRTLPAAARSPGYPDDGDGAARLRLHQGFGTVALCPRPATTLWTRSSWGCWWTKAKWCG